MLKTLREVLRWAEGRSCAVGAFNIDNLEGIQAVVWAAEQTRLPAIIATSESTIRYAGIDNLAALVMLAAKKKGVSLVLHLDHGTDSDLVKECLASGWSSVMIDGSLLSYEKNVSLTKKVVALAHTRGVSVEAELGALPIQEDGEVTASAAGNFFVDPTQAGDFIRRTGIDALAVPVGTSHGPFKAKGKVVLNYALLRAIRKEAKLPLVLHGASSVPKKILSLLHAKCEDMHDCKRLAHAQGVSAGALRKAILCGVRKINVGTDMRLAFTAAFRKSLSEHIEEYDERVFLRESRKCIADLVKDRMLFFARKSSR